VQNASFCIITKIKEKITVAFDVYMGSTAYARLVYSIENPMA